MVEGMSVVINVMLSPLASFSLSAKIVYQGVALGARCERNLGDEW